MGYPVRYRDGAGREARRLSREPNPAPTPQPANDNYRHPRKPANDNFPARVPPKVGHLVRNPAVRRAAQTVMMLHPALRILSTLWKLYDWYEWMKRVQVNYGDYTLACSVPVMSGCTEPMPCCSTLTGNCYCSGPVFGKGLNNPSLCGIGGQAGIAGSGYFVQTRDWDGVITFMYRGQASPPAICHPAKMIQQWRHPAPFSGPGMLKAPQYVPWAVTVPPRWAPHRWYKPQVLMKPGVDYDVAPAPPPYPMVPNRTPEDMWPGERGYSAQEEGVVPLAPPASWRGPPPPRTKEGKVKWTGAAQIAHALLVTMARVHGKLLDLKDILKAMDEALPKELRLKGKDKKKIQALLDNLYRHWDKMDGAKALENIIKEVAEDVIGGASDMLRSETAKNFGWLKTKTFISPRF